MRAYYTFKVNAEYLCQAVAADDGSYPSFGPIRRKELKVVFNVMSLIVGTAGCVPVGQQAVNRYQLDEHLQVIDPEASRFVGDAGILLRRGEKPRIEPGRVVACRFDEPDPQDGYQQILSGRVVDAATYGLVPHQIPGILYPFGIRRIVGKRILTRRIAHAEKKADFKGHSIAFKLCLHLLNTGTVCSNKDLMDHAWGRGQGGEDSLRHHVRFARAKAELLDLTIKCHRGLGYEMVER